MTQDMRLLFFAMAATVAGNIVAALVIWRFMEWRKTRDWRNLIAPAGIGIWVALGLSILVFPSESPSTALSFNLMISGSIIGALISARALFGIIRTAKAETVLGPDPQYKGSLRDILAFIVALAPVLAAAFLF